MSTKDKLKAEGSIHEHILEEVLTTNQVGEERVNGYMYK